MKNEMSRYSRTTNCAKGTLKSLRETLTLYLFLWEIVLGGGAGGTEDGEEGKLFLMPSIYILIPGFTTSLVEMMVYSHLPESL